MKIKSGFMLREIAGSWVVVPFGSRVVEFNGLMTLNQSGVLIWNMLEKGAEIEEIVNMIVSEYSIDETTAKKDVNEIIDQMKVKGLIEF